jgi:hypothetical protein
MSQTQRTANYRRAEGEGQTARIGGIARSENPYTPGEWSLYGWWDMGWQRADTAQRKRSETVTAINHTPDPLTDPLGWCRNVTAELRALREQGLSPLDEALLGAPLIIAFAAELERAGIREAPDGRGGNQTPGGDHDAD